MSATVPFTQYLRPNGRQRPVSIERTTEVATLAMKVRDAGFRFDIEELMTGHVSMTVESNTPDAHGDYPTIAHEICANGPDVHRAVDRLITAAYEHVAKAEGR